ncbi:PBCV-specific basic adaptor domain-containing protein [Paramecium bursaria Chlorella virus Fr5L]|nr:PBCV-specific basic adaptor domain-containing protein [Paramecium bursaria Chlorella virus Fr5L]
MATSVKIPQIRLMPSDNGFMRGQRDITFKINTVSPEEFGTQPIDNSWLQAQAAYFMKLDNDDLYTLISFTVRSHQWITPFLRSGKLPGSKELKMIVQDSQLAPLFPQMRTLVDRGTTVFGKKSISKEMFTDVDHRKYVRNLFVDKKTPLGTRYVAFQMLLRGNDFSDRALKMALVTYNRDLKRLFAGSPATTKKMTVFRGVLTNLIGSKKVVQTKEPSSTSFSMEYAGAYSESNKGSGRIMRIELPKGSKCLALCIVNSFTEAGEFEILLPAGKFIVENTGIRRKLGKNVNVLTNTMKMKV